MTRDDIIRMAREAGFVDYELDDGTTESFDKRYERFAALVASAERERTMEIVQSMKAELEAKFEKTYMEGVVAGASAEREACAKVCDVIAQKMDDEGEGPTGNIGWVIDCAEAIRERP